MIKKRICVYPQDVSVFTGRGDRYSRNIIQKIKAINGKEKHQPVTFTEFADYMNMEPEVIFKIINNISIIDLDTTG